MEVNGFWTPFAEETISTMTSLEISQFRPVSTRLQQPANQSEAYCLYKADPIQYLSTFTMDSQGYKTIIRSLVQLNRVENEKSQKEIKQLNQQMERLKEQMNLQQRQLDQFQLSHMARMRQQRKDALQNYRKQHEEYSSQEIIRNKDGEINIVCDCGCTDVQDLDIPCPCSDSKEKTEQDTID